MSAESRGTGDSLKRKIPPRSRSRRSPPSLHSHSRVQSRRLRGRIPRVQSINEVSLQVFLAVDNPFDVVNRPEECAGCKARGRFHRHGTYCRYIRNELRKVARFICALCRLTVSVLPGFVLPYRSRLVEEVNGCFMATIEQRRNLSCADTLRHYWRQWNVHWQTLQLKTGWPTVRPLARDAQGYWRQLREVTGGLARAQAQLVARFGLSLLRRYACHQVPNRT